MKPPALSPPQKRALVLLLKGRQKTRFSTPLVRANWARTMGRLVELGFATLDGHGGHEITESGKDALRVLADAAEQRARDATAKGDRARAEVMRCDQLTDTWMSHARNLRGLGDW